MADFRQNPFDKIPFTKAEPRLRPRMSHARQAGNDRSTLESIRILTRGTARLLSKGRGSRTIRNRGVGAVVTKVSSRAQRVVVKSRIVPTKPTTTKQSIMAHIQYISRDAVGIDGGDAKVSNRDMALDREQIDDFAERGLRAPRQFRFIISPENGSQLDMEKYTKDLMNQMERDLGTKLDYIMAIHYDTGHPHAHVILNGRDEHGNELEINKQYMSHGMRHRAQEIATHELGLRSELDVQRAIQKDISAEKVTTLDRELQKRSQQNPSKLVDMRVAPDKPSPHYIQHRSNLLSRLNELERFGFAKEVGPGWWELDRNFTDKLKAIGKRLDIEHVINTEGRGYPVNEPIRVIEKDIELPDRVTGKVIAKGLVNELYDNKYLAIAGSDGNIHYTTLSRYSESEGREARAGNIVTLDNRDLRPVTSKRDNNIQEISSRNSGVYTPGRHVEELLQNPGKSWIPDDLTPGEYVQSHVKRMHELAKKGIVEEIGDSTWRVPGALIPAIENYHKEHPDKRINMRVTKESEHSLTEQIVVRGLTWLDRKIMGDNIDDPSMLPRQTSFQKELADSIGARLEKLEELGMTRKVGNKFVVTVAMAENLIAMEIEDATKTLSSTYGEYLPLDKAPLLDGRHNYTGKIKTFVQLPSTTYAVIDTGVGFTIVPEQAKMKENKGKLVEVSMKKGRNIVELNTSLERNRVRFVAMESLNKDKNMGMEL